MRKYDKTELWLAVVGDPPGNHDLWLRVKHWRDRLSNSSKFPVLDNLESSWELLDMFYDHIIKRTNDETEASTPLTAFFSYVEMGFYPPPEIMLALQDAFRVYLASNGDLTLEEVFFGPPKRKAGSYARQYNVQHKRMLWGIEIGRLMDKGHTKAKACEILSKQLGGKPEPETISRLADSISITIRKRWKNK